MLLNLKTSDGVRISIRYEIKSKDTCLILAPGFFQSKETPTFRRMADELRRDSDVIAMDFRGHGLSGGWYTFSAKEAEDLKAVVNFARKAYSKVAVMGFSYGGSISILEEDAYRNIDSLICVTSPMDSRQIDLKWWHPESLRLGFRGLERGAGVRPGNPFMAKRRPLDVVGSIAPKPIFFIHSKNDPTVSLRHSVMLFEHAKEPKRLEILEKGSHAQEIYRQNPQVFLRLVRDWVARTLH